MQNVQQALPAQGDSVGQYHKSDGVCSLSATEYYSPQTLLLHRAQPSQPSPAQLTPA